MTPISEQQDNSEIYRYSTIERLLDLIITRELYFRRLVDYEDSWEAFTPPPPPLNPDDSWTKRLPQAHLEPLKRAAERLYVNCWCRGPKESMAMWDLYGAQGMGVCIKSTTARVRDTVLRVPVIYSRPYVAFHTDVVQYADTFGSPELLPGCAPHISTWTLPLAFQKRTCFEHEREWRVAHFRFEDETAGVRIRVDPDMLIREVIVGPRAEKAVAPMVQDVMTKYGLTAIVKKSTLLDPPRG